MAIETPQTRKKKLANSVRILRTIHRTTGIYLFVVFFIIAVTGLLLGWKKHSGDLILAKNVRGTSTDLATWLPLDKLQDIAESTFRDSLGITDLAFDRVDLRHDKGMIKFILKNEFLALQIDGVTGRILKVEKRNADLIEKIHDGSIVDHYLGINGGYFKLFYTTLSGMALLIFTITGFWLWYGPKKMRGIK